MKYVLNEMSDEEKPREKLKRFGASSLADYELLAVILKTGTVDKSVLDLSIEVLNSFKKLDMMSEITLEELVQIKGIGEAKALSLIASIEFAKRLLKGKNENVTIRNSDDLYNYIKYDLVNEKQEKLICIYLNQKRKIIDERVINIGVTASSLVDLKACMKWGIKLSAVAIIFVHNHPSGDPTPSTYDHTMTDKFKKAAEYVDIQFFDHIIVGRECYYSFKLEKIIYTNKIFYK